MSGTRNPLPLLLVFLAAAVIMSYEAGVVEAAGLWLLGILGYLLSFATWMIAALGLVAVLNGPRAK